ncbi:MAG: sensor histidine kinase [Rikenellaceae bacterium]
MKIDFFNKKSRMITLQLIGWGVILATSLFWSVNSGNGAFDAFGFIIFGVNILTLIIIYLLNYLIFIPKYLFKDNKQLFIIANIALIGILLLCSYLINDKGLFDSLRPNNMPPRHQGVSIYLARDLINYILMIGLVTAMRLAQRLEKSEAALREAENARVKAELDNLRSQINPHFLLNTLNNIYALTAIDTEKAQKTIKELSNLLRYILYDNLNDRVSLKAEVEFIKTYIELMSIRLPRKVIVTTEFKIADNCTTQIAPLIFISLIENAFKHSVSAEGEGFIEIYFEDKVESGEVLLSIKNSNHAKAEQDKSGHGIGLEQVRRRLELLYPDAHSWEVEENTEDYISRLILKE